ncbi:oligosaccharide flippase family protein [Fibrobacterota bacterium]
MSEGTPTPPLGETRILKNIGIVFSSDGVTKVTTFILSIILAKTLPPSDIGIYAYAVSLTTILAYVMDFGINTWILNEGRRERDYLAGSFYKIIKIKSLLFVVFIASVFAVSGLMFGKKNISVVLALFCLMQFSNSIFLYNLSVYRTLLKFNIELYLRMGYQLSMLFLCGFIIISTSDLVSFIATLLVTNISWTVISFVLINKNLRTHKKQAETFTMKKVLSFSLPYFLITLLPVMLMQSDIIMMSLLSSDASTGIYKISFNFFLMISLISFAFFGVYQPSFTTLSVSHQDAYNEKFSRGLYNLILILAPTCLLCGTYATEILTLVYGAAYAEAGLCVKYLVVASFLCGITAYCGITLLHKKKFIALFSISASSLTVLLSLNATLIPLFGINGAGISRVFEQLFLITAHMAVIIRYVKGFVTFKNFSLIFFSWLFVAAAVASSVFLDNSFALGFLNIIIPLTCLFLLYRSLKAMDA